VISNTLAALAAPDSKEITFTSSIDRLVARFVKVTETAIANADLHICSYESPESSIGACDGGRFSCSAKATIHDLETEQDFCAKHFAQVSR
jgi:hypothetical protein